MSFIDKITVLILTYNEAANIRRTLAALPSFSDIVVVDSGSTDGTVEIAKSFPNARIFTRTFDGHASQWNFGLEQCGIKTDWVLALDADYVLTQSLLDEISLLAPEDSVAGYRAAFDYLVYGRALSATLYPPVVALYRRSKAKYVQTGHTQRLQIGGDVCELAAHIRHDDRKSLSRWFVSQQRYAKLEADFLMSVSKSELRTSDRIRLLGWAAPVLVFLYTLIVKGCILNGWRGWLYVLQRTVAEAMIALELIDRRLRKSES
jgi:glycosyltransferase involved in cell wall biosynthesis